MSAPEAPQTIALAGPTASGKTAGALALAAVIGKRMPVEIISVDSALVYRGMDIGTAKPSREELAAVPHHLIDTLDPLDSYSAAEFAKDATGLIKDIKARGKTPLLVVERLNARQLKDAKGEERTITIKGIDEVDNLQGEVSWVSPIARALLKAREGDEIPLMTPGGLDRLEVLQVSYPAPIKA